MLCSKCSAPVRPVVAIDIDGTLGDYHGQLTEFLADYFNECRPHWDMRYQGEESMNAWACRTFGISPDEYRQAKLAYRQGGGKRMMPVVAGAQLLCREIRFRCGAELWLTTTRPYLRLDSTDPDTRFWLGENCIEYDHLLYDDRKYDRLVELVDSDRIVAVLDDLPEMIVQANAAVGRPVGMYCKNPYNPESSPGFKVQNLSQARIEIVDRVYKWRELNE